MSVTIVYSGAGLSHGGTITLDRKLWLTADRGTVVEDGDVRARYLLGVNGDEITVEEARRLDILDDDTPDPEPAKAMPVTKNKQRNISRNKSQEDNDGEE